MSENSFHPNNVHKNGYDFTLLLQSNPDLKSFIISSQINEQTIDFSNPRAVKELNKSLLVQHYNITKWGIPKGFLCPAIPSRADYIHHIADLFENHKDLKGLDIGTGANCIYPILGTQIYGWKFIASDISDKSLKSAKTNLDHTPSLKENIILRQQKNARNIFTGLIQEEDKFDFSICNPPFHSSKEAADKENFKKYKNLNLDNPEPLNFGGQSNELWCDGGELLFLKNMIRESQYFKEQCTWFTSLISKKENVRPLKVALKKLKAKTVKVIPMAHGKKISRILVWSFQQ